MSELALSAGSSHDLSRPEVGATAVMRDLAVEVLAGAAAYDTLRPEWTALAARQPDVVCFQAPEFLSVWARHFGQDPATLRTVVVRQAGQPVLIWPLQVGRKGPITIAGAAGGPIAQYDEVFIDPDCDWADAAWRAMAAVKREIGPDVLTFSHLRPESWLLRAFGASAEPVGEIEGAPYADTSEGIEAIRAGLKTRVRQQQRKRMQKFAAAGTAAFEVAAEPDQAEAWLEEILTVKRRWLVSTGRVSRAFTDPRTASCLRDLARHLSPPTASPRTVISRLTLDGAMAAMEVGFSHRGSYHLYIGAFSEELGSFGPGNVLTEKVLEWCGQNGIARYDMMVPRTRNKGEWQTGEVAVGDYVLPLTRLGRVYAATVTRRLTPALRAGFYRLPVSWRSAVAERKLRI